MTEPRPAKPCPICGKTAEPTHLPFCSARCRSVDLGRWFNEDYKLPDADPIIDEDELD